MNGSLKNKRERERTGANPEEVRTEVTLVKF